MDTYRMKSQYFFMDVTKLINFSFIVLKHKQMQKEMNRNVWDIFPPVKDSH